MENRYYRTFIGLPVKTGEEFQHARNQLLEALSKERISWVKPGNDHITLRFIGDTKVSAIDGIGTKLLEEVTIPGKFELCFSRLDSFGPRKKPRVIWVGFKDTLLIESLKADVDHALESAGIPAGIEVFRAHLTLGRVRSLKDPATFYSVLSEMGDRFRSMVQFDQLVFYRSELGSGGPVYTPLMQIDFKG